MLSLLHKQHINFCWMFQCCGRVVCVCAIHLRRFDFLAVRCLHECEHCRIFRILLLFISGSLNWYGSMVNVVTIIIADVLIHCEQIPCVGIVYGTFVVYRSPAPHSHFFTLPPLLHFCGAKRIFAAQRQDYFSNVHDRNRWNIVSLRGRVARNKN